MKRVFVGLGGSALVAAALTVSSPSSISAQQGGSIEGHVRVTAVPAANPIIRMSADPNCLKINAGKRVVQDTERVSGTVRKERAVIDHDGDVDVDHRGEGLPHESETRR